MPSSQAVKKELEDLEMKVDNAREAAARPGAGERDKSDLKMAEQELMGARQQAKHANHAAREEGKAHGTDPVRKVDAKLDAALKESFPGSDPVSMVQAAPVKKHDADLPSVKAAEHQQPEKTAKAKKSNL